MRKMALIPGALALALAACGVGLAGTAIETAVSVATPAKAAGDKVVLEGTRGLILAHNAFQGGIAAVNPLVRSRVLTSAQVDRYEQLVNEGERLFNGAGSTLTIAQRTAALLNVANELSRLAGK